MKRNLNKIMFHIHELYIETLSGKVEVLKWRLRTPLIIFQHRMPFFSIFKSLTITSTFKSICNLLKGYGRDPPYTVCVF